MMMPMRFAMPDPLKGVSAVKPEKLGVKNQECCLPSDVFASHFVLPASFS